MIEDPAAAAVALDPIRSRLLQALVEPGSAAALASKIGITRQKVNYHLHALEAHGLVEVAEERKRGGITERVMRATAASYVVSPAALAEGAVDPDQAADRLSARYVVALAGRVVREVGDLARAREHGREASADHGDRHRDPISFGGRPRRVRRRAHRGAARTRRALPPRRRPAAPSRRRCPPEARARGRLSRNGDVMTTPDVPLRMELTFELPGVARSALGSDRDRERHQRLVHPDRVRRTRRRRGRVPHGRRHVAAARSPRGSRRIASSTPNPAGLRSPVTRMPRSHRSSASS